ncbi:MAG: glycosyltransferase 87 family protein [Anaeroplasmataceae bacterium]
MKNLLSRLSMKDNLLKMLFYISIASFLLVLIGYIIMIIAKFEYANYNTHIFSDYAETLCFSLMKNPYEAHTILKEDLNMACIYPPIAYMILYPFALICKKDIMTFNNNYSVNTLYSLDWFIQRPLFVLSYVIYFLLFMSLILLLAYKISGLKGKNAFYFLTTILLSGSMLYAFIRGNTIFIVLLSLLCFYYFYEKCSFKGSNVLALFFLALSITIKIYPVFFSIILINRRGLKQGIIDLLICGCMTLILVFVPFMFTNGGFDNVKLLIDNAFFFTDKTKRLTNLTNVSILSIIYSVLSPICKLFGGTLSVSVAKGLTYLITIPVFVLCIFLSFKVKERYKCYFIAVMAYFILQNTSYAYSLLLFLLPFIIFISDYDNIDDNGKNKYTILFIISLWSIIYFLKFIKINTIILLILLIFIAVDVLKRKKERKMTSE